LILQSLEELESDLKRELRQVYLVLGPEIYQCRSAIALLKKHALSPDSAAFDFSEFNAGEASIDEIMEAGGTFPMVSKRRLVLVADVEHLKESDQGRLLDSLTDLSKRSMLVLLAEELDHRKKFYKTLRDKHCVAEFSKLKGVALEHWAEAFIRKQGYRSSSPTIKKIVELVGSDLQTLASELEKLMLSSGKEKDISKTAVEDLVRASRQHGIFELINAIGQRDRAGALRSLANLLSMGEHPLVVVTMMARHCRQILIAKEGLLQGSNTHDIASAAQIPPFILDQFLRQARAIDAASIQEMYIRLAEIDKRLKSTSLDGRIMLEALICALV
jgi:DNA polymerase III subunit delta